MHFHSFASIRKAEKENLVPGRQASNRTALLLCHVLQNSGTGKDSNFSGLGLPRWVKWVSQLARHTGIQTGTPTHPHTPTQAQNNGSTVYGTAAGAGIGAFGRCTAERKNKTPAIIPPPSTGIPKRCGLAAGAVTCLTYLTRPSEQIEAQLLRNCRWELCTAARTNRNTVGISTKYSRSSARARIVVFVCPWGSFGARRAFKALHFTLTVVQHTDHWLDS